ncbi:MAG TPA: TonB-dependent receptor [Bryobacteraceae bacterium]|nr:TonB-dependent receptor [Bryobacteraceae bacterium]
MYHFILLAAALLPSGAVEGTVTLESTGKPVHHVTVVLPQINKSTETDDDGKFRFPAVPEGEYDILAQSAGLADTRKKIRVTKDNTASIDFSLRLTPLRQEITVTASGKVETTLEAINSVTTLDTLDLAAKPGNSLGDILDGQPGVSKRSFGPGTTRPVLRGFDGDRVLIMQDGVRTGTLSSQSGDHGEPVDPQSLERVEIVRGPATLLYGSNAIGGVVNMITDHHAGQDDTHDGVHGYLSTIGGSNNGLHGGSAGVSAGSGPWVMRMNMGGQRTSDYDTARERVINSGARTLSGGASLSRYSKIGWFTFAYNTQRGTYQIPQIEGEEERVQLPFTRHNVRATGGLHDKLNFSLNYSNWEHNEVANGEIENQFFNKQFDYRLVVDQKRKGPFSGNFGVWGLHRDYEAVGAEATTPPIKQRSFAVFGLESIQLERLRLQFGGRVEDTRYNPQRGERRAFTGFSGSAGANVPLWRGGAFVASYNHSYRAPALEELYAFGPHAGNLTFEVGDHTLRGERSNGFDTSIRHTSARYRAEANWFYYRLNNYVYLAPTGEVEDGLTVANYSQNNARYVGFDGRYQAALHNNVWLNLGFDMVNAELRINNTPLPRIPPGRGRIGLDFRFKALSIAPELVLARRQDRIYTTETETAGYATGNLRATYTLARQHAVHLFSFTWFNANNAYYRNHLSFIKDSAAEMGRGVVASYNVRFF